HLCVVEKIPCLAVQEFHHHGVPALGLFGVAQVQVAFGQSLGHVIVHGAHVGGGLVTFDRTGIGHLLEMPVCLTDQCSGIVLREEPKSDRKEQQKQYGPC